MLVLFGFQIIGFVIAYKGMEYQAKRDIKKQIKKGLEDSDMVLLSLEHIASSKTFEWKKEGEEFVFEGQMYDIVKSKNGMAYCINDRQEQRLFANIDQLLKQYFASSKEKRQGLQHIASIFFGEYLVPETLVSVPHDLLTIKNSYILRDERYHALYTFSMWRPPIA